MLYIDYAPLGGAVGISKTIVPRLEVETMNYYRIGERNTRKLIERDHPLITFGRPCDTLLPVRLTPEAIACFGCRPLFDIAFAGRIVGDYYPLYHDPESPHASFRYEHQGRRAGRVRA